MLNVISCRGWHHIASLGVGPRIRDNTQRAAFVSIAARASELASYSMEALRNARARTNGSEQSRSGIHELQLSRTSTLKSKCVPEGRMTGTVKLNLERALC